MQKNQRVLLARTNIIAENALMLRDDIQAMTSQEVEDTISVMEQTLGRLRESFNSGELSELLKK
jgi:hypothetical protein